MIMWATKTLSSDLLVQNTKVIFKRISYQSLAFHPPTRLIHVQSHKNIIVNRTNKDSLLKVSDKEQVKPLKQEDKTMNYFVIGLSGVTSGGKTTLSKLIQKSFPWARTIHQDKYFYPDDYEGHVRMPDCENHANFELFSALNMDQMVKDVQEMLKAPGLIPKEDQATPNFEASAMELVKNIIPLDVDTSIYKHVPILIIEGFTIFASEFIYKISDSKIYLTLDEEECRRRRSGRNFDPPDGPGYFDKAIWPEYLIHLEKFILPRSGPTDILTISGSENPQKLWSECVSMIVGKLEEKVKDKASKSI